MALIKPLPEAPWFEIDEDQYLMYLLKGYEIKSRTPDWIYFALNGKLHREDGPAGIHEGGFSAYCLYGEWQKSVSPSGGTTTPTDF